MLRFISFGSGSSGNCYYLFTETDSLLIDVGVGIRTLKKHFHNYGLRFEDVHNILITHDHADHVKSVGSLSNDYHLPVYTTRKVHSGIENNYCVRKKINGANVHVVEKGVPFTLGEFRITPFVFRMIVPTMWAIRWSAGVSPSVSSRMWAISPTR